MKLTPPQEERVKAKTCACGCGEPVRMGRAYPEESTAHRQRARRERLAWEASGQAARHQLQRRLDQVLGELGRLTAQIDRLTTQRKELRELAADLQARLSPQVELPVVTSASSSPANVTEQLHPVDVAWRLLTSSERLTCAGDRWQLLSMGHPVGWLPAGQVEAIIAAGLLRRDGDQAQPTGVLVDQYHRVGIRAVRRLVLKAAWKGA